MLSGNGGESGENEKEIKRELADPLKEATDSAKAYFSTAFDPAEILKSFQFNYFNHTLEVRRMRTKDRLNN